MTTLDPRALEEAAEAVGRHIHCLRRNCHRCRRTAEAAITAYLAVAQPIVERRWTRTPNPYAEEGQA